jgi:dTDP-4-dehydrorhamnose reductase
MRVLILGGAGMLGHRLVLSFRDEFDTWTTLRASVRAYARYGIFDPRKTIDGVDIVNLDTVIGAVAKARPDVVVNCIGVIKQLPTAQDPIVSLSVNSLFPHRLHQLCLATGVRLVHFSTDCVFSGRKGMYTEEDPPDALDLYGRTKFLGETSGEGAITIRSSIIGRELSSSSGLVEWFLSQRGGQVEGYKGAIYSGFTTLAMARIIRTVLVDHPGLSGTLQVSSVPINKYDLLCLLRQAYRADVQITPSDRVQIDRSLDSSRFRALTGFVPPTWTEMISEMAADRLPYEEWRGRPRQAVL